MMLYSIHSFPQAGIIVTVKVGSRHKFFDSNFKALYAVIKMVSLKKSSVSFRKLSNVHNLF